MKKIITMLAVICFALLLVACVSEMPAGEYSPIVPQEFTIGANDSRLLFYNDVTEADYYNYIGLLSQEKGYSVVQEYTMGNSKYALMKRSSYHIFVSYLAKSGNLRIVFDESSDNYPAPAAPEVKDVCEPTLWQLYVDTSAAKDNGGMSYVMQLTDGTFVVVDGGYDTDAKHLYNLLEENKIGEGKPVISAWIISHLHTDHYGALKKMSTDYKDKVEVKAFYYNFPGIQCGDISPANGSDIEKAMRQWGGAKRYSAMHSGMNFSVADAKFTVICTYEDVFPKSIENGNDTSMVIKAEIAGQSIMFLADAYYRESIAMTTYVDDAVLKSDIVQVSHHGYEGCKEELYAAVNATTALWPMPIVGYKNNALFKEWYEGSHNTYVRTSEDIKKIIVSGAGTAKLSLPYTPAGERLLDYELFYNAHKNGIQGTVGEQDPGAAVMPVVNITSAEQFLALVDNINSNPSMSKGVVYRLLEDIVFADGWSGKPSAAFGKFVAPESIAPFPGIKEFYGVFDGNGKTITALCRVDSESSGGAVGGLIDKLNGGTVKNLTLHTAYIYDDGGNGAPVGGLVGTVNGNGAVIENVTVYANIYAVTDGFATMGGIVGSVKADDLIMKNCTFGGQVGVIGGDRTIPSASTVAVIGQLVGNANNKKFTLDTCAANGEILCSDSATKSTYCATGAVYVTNSNCTVTPPATQGITEVNDYKIYTAEEFLMIGAFNSTFEGKTITLMANIDLNKGWKAGTAAPSNVWAGIAEFKGLLDGNGMAVYGLYRIADGVDNAGLIDVLNGGTVKNLAILNSAVVYRSGSVAANVGLIGSANGGNVEALYTDLLVSVTDADAARVGGIIGANTGATTVKNAVFNGTLSAAGAVVDQIIASQSPEAVVEDILAIGAGAVSLTGRTRVITEKTDAVPAGYDWQWAQYVKSIVPKPVLPILLPLYEIIPDTSWYSDAESEFVISTPEQLFGLSVLASRGKTFAGKTIKLGADIFLNSGWDATTVISNKIVRVASAPRNVWIPIPLFEGTLDGQGYAINGIYSYTDYDVPPSESAYFGGFINILKGGTIKNLIVENSLAYFTSTTAKSGTNRTRIGGFIGRVVDSTLDTLYVDMDAWHATKYHYTMGGLICEIDTEARDHNYVGSIANIVYAGTTGRICSDGTWNKSEGADRIFAAGMIAQNHNATASNPCNITMSNLSFIGVVYRPTCPKGVSADALLAYTGGSAYSQGMAANNTSTYTDEAAFGAEAGKLNKTESLIDKAIDITSAGGKVNTSDTYSTNRDWATIDIETGAGINTGVILPKTVVDMLNARNV